jgi:hypothetical protein
LVTQRSESQAPLIGVADLITVPQNIQGLLERDSAHHEFCEARFLALLTLNHYTFPMPRSLPPRKPKLTNAERQKRFVETAKKVEASEKLEDFDIAFKNLVVRVAKPRPRA